MSRSTDKSGLWDLPRDHAMAIEGELRLHIKGLNLARFHKIWCDGTNNEQYTPPHNRELVVDPDVLEDATGLEPTPLDQMPGDDCVQCLVVGVIDMDLNFPDDPHTTQDGAARRRPRTSSGDELLVPDFPLLRVVYVMTEKIVTGPKLYVAVPLKTESGRCALRPIKAGKVFFFSEYWEGVPQGLMKSKRQPAVLNAVKRNGARNQVEASSSVVQVREQNNPRDFTAISKEENLGALLAAQEAFHSELGQPESLAIMLNHLELYDPSLRFRPSSSDQGVRRFFDFRAPMSMEEVQQLRKELQASNENITDQIDDNSVLATHRTLVELGIGPNIPYSALPFFLCHVSIYDLDPDNQEFMQGTVETSVTAARLHYRFPANTTLSSTTDHTTAGNTGALLRSFLFSVREAAGKFAEASVALEGSWGKVAKHTGLEDLRKKFFSTVDRTAFQSFATQIMVIFRDQFTAGAANMSQHLLELCRRVDQGLANPRQIASSGVGSVDVSEGAADPSQPGQQSKEKDDRQSVQELPGPSGGKGKGKASAPRASGARRRSKKATVLDVAEEDQAESMELD